MKEEEADHINNKRYIIQELEMILQTFILIFSN
jgi:hypothetical protein